MPYCRGSETTRRGVCALAAAGLMAVAAALRIPVLALYGDLDKQAPSGDNARVLQRLWAAHPDATVRVLPGLNHFLQHARSGLPAEIPEIDETMAPEALDAIADWVVKRFGGSR